MFRMIVGVGVCFLFCCAGRAQQQARSSKRAILIVNSQYRKLPRLASPHLDGVVLEGALGKAGFDAVKYEDNLTTLSQFEDGFLKTVNPGDVVLVFYSGYAVQSGNDNFLLPVNYDPGSADPLVNTAFSLTRIQQDLEDQKVSMSILLVDGAHDERQLDRVSASPGLAPPQVSGAEECFLFSAPLNQAAPAAPAGSAGALATAFAKAIVQADSGLNKTMLEVAAALGNRPFFSNQVTQSFYFAPPAPLPAAPSTAAIAPRPAVDVVTQVPQTNRQDREEYRFISKGTFQMGCVPGSTCEAAEKPRHEVHLTKDFWIGVTDVTVNAFKRFRKPPKQGFWSSSKDWSEYHPVVNASWADASAFCQWVGGRLPTEAEWEYAARGGQADQAFPFDSQNARDKANFSSVGRKGNDVYDYTSPVKSFDPNSWGLYDMAGDVWQWTADWFDANYYSTSPADDPTGPDTGKERVVRGGSFRSDPAKHLRISYRDKFPPEAGPKLDAVGFRCVLEDSPETRSLLNAGKR
jgi:formylglycine-generating enzyme required for sulfatase activity